MVVRSTTAVGAARRRVPAGAGPVRTCIGCRNRAAAAELLRVVVARGSAGTADHPDPVPAGRSSTSGSAPVLVVPDQRRRAPGRGAWLHFDPGCVALAERRRAFARALRVPGQVDLAPVREYLVEHSAVEN